MKAKAANERLLAHKDAIAVRKELEENDVILQKCLKKEEKLLKKIDKEKQLCDKLKEYI